jgi:hypothetical protein
MSINEDKWQIGVNMLIDALPKEERDSESNRATIARYATDAMKTDCCKCGHRWGCEFAFDTYNIGISPGVDCLAAK